MIAALLNRTAPRGRRRPASPRRRLINILSWLLVLCGLAVLGQGLIIPAKATLAQVLLDRAFTQAQHSGHAVRPWPWADTWPVARLSVPRLHESEIVLAGGTGQAMAFGPTLLPEGVQPGQPGTAVFAAHRDTHFSFVRHLTTGDLVLVEGVDGTLKTFRVTGHRVVHKDGYVVDRNTSVPTIALTTCWPFDATTHGPWRYVVTAEMIGG